MSKADAAKTAGQQRGKPFQKGKSGNPAGRPLGSRHRTTLAMETLLDGEAENLTRRAVDLALDGDSAALRLCMERLLPARKSRPINLTLPKIEKSADVLKAMSEVVAAVAGGQIDVDEGASLAGLLDLKRRAIESVDIENRLAALEAKETK
jgi:hypothetical protein